MPRPYERRRDRSFLRDGELLPIVLEPLQVWDPYPRGRHRTPRRGSARSSTRGSATAAPHPSPARRCGPRILADWREGESICATHHGRSIACRLRNPCRAFVNGSSGIRILGEPHKDSVPASGRGENVDGLRGGGTRRTSFSRPRTPRRRRRVNWVSWSWIRSEGPAARANPSLRQYRARRRTPSPCRAARNSSEPSPSSLARAYASRLGKIARSGIGLRPATTWTL
jgi:hypothetical protein